MRAGAQGHLPEPKTAARAEINARLLWALETSDLQVMHILVP